MLLFALAVVMQARARHVKLIITGDGMGPHTDDCTGDCTWSRIMVSSVAKQKSKWGVEKQHSDTGDMVMAHLLDEAADISNVHPDFQLPVW